MSADVAQAVQKTVDGVRLIIKAKPGSARERAVRLVEIAGGGFALEIAVAEPPEDGKANKALQSKIANLCDVKKKDVRLKSGQTSRLKVFDIEGDAETLIRALQQKIT